MIYPTVGLGLVVEKKTHLHRIMYMYMQYAHVHIACTGNTCTCTCNSHVQVHVHYLGILVGYCISGISLMVGIDDVLVPATNQLSVLPRTLRVGQTSPLAQVLLRSILTMSSSYMDIETYTYILCKRYKTKS